MIHSKKTISKLTEQLMDKSSYLFKIDNINTLFSHMIKPRILHRYIHNFENTNNC